MKGWEGEGRGGVMRSEGEERGVKGRKERRERDGMRGKVRVGGASKRLEKFPPKISILPLLLPLNSHSMDHSPTLPQDRIWDTIHLIIKSSVNGCTCTWCSHISSLHSIFSMMILSSLDSVSSSNHDLGSF